MLSLIFYLVVVSWLLPGILAPQNPGADYGPSTAAWTPRPTTFVENVHKRDISPGANSLTSIPAAPTSEMIKPTNNAASSTGEVAGILVAIILAVGMLICGAWIYPVLRWRGRRSRDPNLQINPEPAPESKLTTSQVPIASSVATFFAFPDGRLRSDQGLINFKDGSIEYRFMVFLELFGINGVPLRELIWLAALRTSTETSHNHWLIDGERGPLRQTIDETTYEECSFLAALTRKATTIQSIEIFQERLVSLGFINIDYQNLSETHSSAQKCWSMDGRIWSIKQRFSLSSSIGYQSLFEVFLEVFTEIPCKDISPRAERQREIHYSHAHLAIVGLYRKSTSTYLYRRLIRQRQVILVILQVLSHRFQRGDEALLGFAKENLPVCGLHPDWNIILLVAELKATISNNYGNLLQISEKVFQVVQVSVTDGDSSPRAKGLSGWLLVELLDAAEAQDCDELIATVVQTGKQWMQRLLGSKLSSLEQTMLCRALARFGNSDYSEPQPRQYDLLLGYQLSRAGCIERAEELLLSGLEYYAYSPMSMQIWEYRFELVSLMLRAGRWSEAEAWLARTRESAISRKKYIPYIPYLPWVAHETKFWKRSGEYGETFVLLGLYQADCDMAMGKLKSAEDRLKDTMKETLFVRDYYIRALRLALRTRLLNVQMWQEIWERATVTAQDLVEDTIASGHCLSTARSSYSVIVIVLTLINKLLWVGEVLAAARLMESLKRFEDADHHVLPLDIKLYLERRRAAVSHLLSLEGSSAYGRHLRESGADAEDATTIVPVDPNSLRAQVPRPVKSDTRAMGIMPFRADLRKNSSAHKWSSGMEHDFDDYFQLQSNRLRLGERRGAVHRGNPVAEKLAQAPHPPSHDPYALEEQASVEDSERQMVD